MQNALSWCLFGSKKLVSSEIFTQLRLFPKMAFRNEITCLLSTLFWLKVGRIRGDIVPYFPVFRAELRCATPSSSRRKIWRQIRNCITGCALNFTRADPHHFMCPGPSIGYRIHNLVLLLPTFRALHICTSCTHRSVVHSAHLYAL